MIRLAPFFGNTSRLRAARIVDGMEAARCRSALWSLMMRARVVVVYASGHIYTITAGNPPIALAFFALALEKHQKWAQGPLAGEREPIVLLGSFCLP